jgi:hypothetical protein
MAKERLPALHVVALAKNPLSASQLASVRNATGLASAAATFVAARAKSNHQSSNPARQLTRDRPRQQPSPARRGASCGGFEKSRIQTGPKRAIVLVPRLRPNLFQGQLASLVALGGKDEEPDLSRANSRGRRALDLAARSWRLLPRPRWRCVPLPRITPVTRGDGIDGGTA